jgi:hypothetical protein
MEKILLLFRLNGTLKLKETHHLTPDSDCYLFQDNNGNKLALLKADWLDELQYEQKRIESTGVAFVCWLHPKGRSTHDPYVVYHEGNYYALALVK